MHPDIRQRLREISKTVSIAKMGVTGVSGVTAAGMSVGHTPSHPAVTPSQTEKHQRNQRATPVTPCHTLELQGGDVRHTLKGVADRVTEGVAAESLNPEDWLAHFEERAAIREYEGGFDRVEAERLAMDDTIAALGPKPELEQPKRPEAVTFEQIIAPMLDHLVEVAGRAKVRGTIVASDPKRRSKRTNKHIVTVFTISAISRGVKASAGPLVTLEDKLNITPPHKRFIRADTLGREANTLMSHGGDWPRWIAVVEGDHTRCGYPTDPESFDTWFPDYTATKGITVIGDWRDEARDHGALDWLSKVG